MSHNMCLGDTIDFIRRRWPAVVSSAPEAPVFILAAGWRSGSTLLQRVLIRKCLIWGEPFGASGFLGRLAESLGAFSDRWPEEGALVSTPVWDRHAWDAMWTANLYPPVQALLDAHLAFFRALLGEPSRARGYDRWGLKEVRYGMDHAVYLRWLFPRAKFVFLVRNPYDCWASYAGMGADWVRVHPEPAVTTPEAFGRHWVSVVASCVDRFARVDGFPIRYEELVRADYDWRPLGAYLGVDPDPAARDVKIGAAPAGRPALDGGERERLRQVVGPLAERLGYRDTGPHGG